MTTETLSTRNEPERSVANDWQRYDQTAITPPVDVTEDAAGITLYADLPGVSRDKLQLQVETDTPARLKVWISDQAPGFIDGTPWIPNPDYFGQTWNRFTSFTFALDGLAAGTLHHILVTATDAEGRTAYRLGTFETLDPPPLPPAVEGRTLKVTFFKGTSLKPVPPGGTDKEARWIDVHEDDLDEAQMTKWVKQAAAIPGWGGS